MLDTPTCYDPHDGSLFGLQWFMPDFENQFDVKPVGVSIKIIAELGDFTIPICIVRRGNLDG